MSTITIIEPVIGKASVSIVNAIGGATVVEDGSALVAAIVNWTVPPQDSSLSGSVDWKILSGAGGPALSDFFVVSGGTLTSPTSGVLSFGAAGDQASPIVLHVTPTADEPHSESFAVELLDPSASAVLGAASSITITFQNPAAGDLLFQNTTSGQASIWDVNGSTLIGGAVSSNPGPSWRAVGTGDFNDDGHPDILWQNASTGQVSVWEMNGNSLIGGGPVSPDPGPSWRAVGTGDFNDDSRSDILFQNSSTGQVSIWEMNGNKLIGGGPVSPNPGLAWKAVGTGDFNGDGHSDILFQNTTSGQVSIWEMNGTSLMGGGPVSANPGTSWHAIGTGDGGSDILFQNTTRILTAVFGSIIKT
jgi:hypothetical protein